MTTIVSRNFQLLSDAERFCDDRIDEVVGTRVMCGLGDTGFVLTHIREDQVFRLAFDDPSLGAVEASYEINDC